MEPDHEYIAAGDEVVFGKAGKETYGLGRFFSSLQHRVIPGLSFLCFRDRCSRAAIVSDSSRSNGQGDRRQKKKKGKEKPSQDRKTSCGSTRKAARIRRSEPPILSPGIIADPTRFAGIFGGFERYCAVHYLVMDGHFGNYPSAWMVLQTGLQFVSKLRYDAALYEPFTGKYRGRGPASKYGDKVDVRKMKKKYLKADDTGRWHSHPNLSSRNLLNKEFAFPINVVVILKTNLSTHKQAHVILFSTDLKLPMKKSMITTLCVSKSSSISGTPSSIGAWMIL